MLEISLTHWNETIDLESIRTIMICFWRHIKTLEFSLVYPFYVTISSALMPFLWTQVLGSTTQHCLINLPCSFALTIPLTDTFTVAFILKLQVTTFMGSIDVIFPMFSLVLLQTMSQSFNRDFDLFLLQSTSFSHSNFLFAVSCDSVSNLPHEILTKTYVYLRNKRHAAYSKEQWGDTVLGVSVRRLEVLPSRSHRVQPAIQLGLGTAQLQLPGQGKLVTLG